MNLALGALAVALSAGILAVLFVGVENSPSPAEAEGGATATVSVTESTDPDPTPTSATETTPDQPSTSSTSNGEPFEIPESGIEGLWQSTDGAVTLDLTDDAVQSLEWSDGDYVLSIAGSADLGALPTETQPVQTILDLIVEDVTGTVTGPAPRLGELVFTLDGLLLTISIGDTELSAHLLPV